jgi:hypothetical protein
MNLPQPTTHTSIPTATWTKITTVTGRQGRRYLLVVNEDSSTNFRLETCNATEAASLTSASGILLSPGGSYEEKEGLNISLEDVYVYQASGSSRTTLSVKEGY